MFSIVYYTNGCQEHISVLKFLQKCIISYSVASSRLPQLVAFVICRGIPCVKIRNYLMWKSIVFSNVGCLQVCGSQTF